MTTEIESSEGQVYSLSPFQIEGRKVAWETSDEERIVRLENKGSGWFCRAEAGSFSVGFDLDGDFDPLEPDDAATVIELFEKLLKAYNED